MTNEDFELDRIDRRRFLLRVGGSVATITATGATVGFYMGCSGPQDLGHGKRTKWSDRNALPNSNTKIQPVPGTRQELTPIEDHYKVVNISVPKITDFKDWRLKVSGLIEQPLY